MKEPGEEGDGSEAPKKKKKKKKEDEKKEEEGKERWNARFSRRRGCRR